LLRTDVLLNLLHDVGLVEILLALASEGVELSEEIPIALTAFEISVVQSDHCGHVLLEINRRHEARILLGEAVNYGAEDFVLNSIRREAVVDLLAEIFLHEAVESIGLNNHGCVFLTICLNRLHSRGVRISAPLWFANEIGPKAAVAAASDIIDPKLP